MINGKTLQRLRTLKGLKQKEAAKKMGISPSTYAKLEQSPWLEGAKLQAVLTALECSTNDLEKAMAILN